MADDQLGQEIAGGDPEEPTLQVLGSGNGDASSSLRRTRNVVEELEENVPPKALSSDPPDLTYPERERRRDKTREKIGLILITILLFLMVAPWVSIWVNSSYDSDAKDLFSLTAGPLIGLLGAAIGFYFGERSTGR